LRRLLGDYFRGMLADPEEVSRTVDRFLKIVEERTGLLAARGEGLYGFSHLAFQEYFAARAVAARDDYVAYTLARCGDPWWRETLLLEAGFLSTQSRERVTRLIQAVADCKKESAPYHTLLLATEMLRDAGSGRVEENLTETVSQRLRQGLEVKTPQWRRWLGKTGVKGWIERRGAVIEALARAEAGYWMLPYGEPEWVTIPAGKFWMGESDSAQRVHVDTFLIAKAPITNAQYELFVKAKNYEKPEHWESGHPPREKMSHPVIYVSQHDAMAYCEWLSEITGKAVRLPTEAEWEKAARGDRDRREYPWGDKFEVTRCNSWELGLEDTTPVGIFPEGASPYGVLDLSGNVWEWTQPNAVLRGGAFYRSEWVVRCASRLSLNPYLRYDRFGFRVVVGIPHTSDL